MLSGDSVDELIEELTSLRLQENEVLQRLALARAREIRQRSYSTNEQTQDSTRRTVVTNEVQDKSATGINNNTKTFTKGARVRILNRVKVAAGKAVTHADKRAFITKVTPERVYFTTLNGWQTWRARKNLRLVTDEEVW